MQIIVNKEKKHGYFIQVGNETRRKFMQAKEYCQWAIFEELLSCESGKPTTVKNIRENIGFSEDMWRDHSKELIFKGHLERKNKYGTKEWTFVFHEKAIKVSEETKEDEKWYRITQNKKKEKKAQKKKTKVQEVKPNIDMPKVYAKPEKVVPS